MSRTGRALAAIVILSSVAALSIGRVSATDASQSSDTAAGALLAEVRSLRTEIRQLASASLRTQLLVARLQLQEQRIAALARQQFDTRAQLAEVEKKRSEAEASVQMLERNADPNVPAKEIEGVLGMMKTQLAAQRQRENELRSHEAALGAAVAAEQARWTEFNDRLDAVEQELQVR
jgi:hypothetical protein